MIILNINVIIIPGGSMNFFLYINESKDTGFSATYEVAEFICEKGGKVF